MIVTDTPQPEVDKRIVAFLKAQTALTLATSFNNIPYCSSCFFAYSEADNLILFKSSENTAHIEQGLKNEKVAISVLPDKLVTGKVQGIQMAGNFSKAEGDIYSSAKKVYYKKYPFALAIPGEVWVVKPTWIKFTDNTLGFGSKLKWEAI